MTCDSVSKLIPLYFYGELNPDEEDRVEQHVHECRECSGALDRQRELAAALDRRRVEVPPLLLEECRADLLAAIRGGAPRVETKAKGPWTLFLEAMGATFTGLTRFRQPAGALALLAVGFFSARFLGTTPTPSPTPTAANQSTPDETYATVRSVQADNAGHVQIAFDETRRRTVSGAPDNPNIRRLLLAATREDNPAVRVESVGLLKTHAGSGEVRDVLLNALVHDPNAGVRLRALDGLKPLASDPDVRKTLATVLLNDDNPGVRMQAVDLLVTHRDGSMVGMLQDMVQKEDNNAIRLKIEKALKDMNASVGTF
jgi:HEAT repeats/Putative zinc-finger